MLAETAVALKAHPWIREEYPFLHAAEMIWSQRTGDYIRADSAAQTLLAEERQVRQRGDFVAENPRFLFGLTFYDLLNADWRRAVAELVNPDDCEATQLAIDALVRGASR